jgi:hypothetical protein
MEVEMKVTLQMYDNHRIEVWIAIMPLAVSFISKRHLLLNKCIMPKESEAKQDSRSYWTCLLILF